MLVPTGNLRGSYKFLNLEIGRVTKWYQFIEYPITPVVQRQIAELAERNEQDAELTFHIKAVNIIGDDNKGAIDLMEANGARLAPPTHWTCALKTLGVT